jgi:hypothetical protein
MSGKFVCVLAAVFLVVATTVAFDPVLDQARTTKFFEGQVPRWRQDVGHWAHKLTLFTINPTERFDQITAQPFLAEELTIRANGTIASQIRVFCTCPVGTDPQCQQNVDYGVSIAQFCDPARNPIDVSVSPRVVSNVPFPLDCGATFSGTLNALVLDSARTSCQVLA